MKRLGKLFKIAKSYYWIMILIILFAVLNRFTYSYVPLHIQYLFAYLNNPLATEIYQVNFPNFILNFLWPNDGIVTVIKLALMLSVFQLFRFIMLFFESFYRGKLNEDIQMKLRNKLYSHIQSLEYSYHNNVDVGDLIQRVTSDIETTSSFLSERIAELFGLLSTIIFGAYQLFFINRTMMIVSLVMLPLSAVSSIIYFRFVTKVFITIEEDEANMVTIIQENLQGMKVVRAFNNEAYEIKKMDEANLKYSKSARKHSKIMAIYWGSSDIISMLQYCLVVIFAIFMVKDNKINPEQVIATLLLIGMLIWPIRGLGRMIGDLGRALVSSDRIYEVLEHESEFTVNGTMTPPLNQKIEFKDVSFKFSDSDEHLLKNVNFTIEQGETVAIIGKTGSGKSTIVNLLLRLLEIEQGDILFSGISIKDIEKHYLRKNIGVVLQEPFLYSKTVYENIAIANNLIEPERVYKAANIAYLEEEIKSFDKGYSTLVGEKGTTLSGGQKQRVAIARVLIEDKPILIFDDSLSAVDTKTDLGIRKALKEKSLNVTTIIITHRITTAKEADKIIVLEKGSVSEIGTHEILKNKKGLYKTLWDLQGSLEEEFLKLIEEE